MRFVFEQICYHYADVDAVKEPKLVSAMHGEDIKKLIENGYISEKKFRDGDGVRRTGYVITPKGLKTVIFADIFKRTKEYYSKNNKKLEYAKICKKVEQIAAAS